MNNNVNRKIGESNKRHLLIYNSFLNFCSLTQNKPTYMHKMLTSDLLKTQDGWALHLFMINYGQIWAPGICSNKLLGPWGKRIYPEIPSCQLHWSHLLQGTDFRQSNMRMEATLRRLKDCLFHILIAWAIKQTHLVLMSLEYCTFSVSHMPLLMLLWAAHFGLEVRLLAFFFFLIF